MRAGYVVLLLIPTVSPSSFSLLDFLSRHHIASNFGRLVCSIYLENFIKGPCFLHKSRSQAFLFLFLLRNFRSRQHVTSNLRRRNFCESFHTDFLATGERVFQGSFLALSLIWREVEQPNPGNLPQDALLWRKQSTDSGRQLASSSHKCRIIPKALTSWTLQL